MNKYTANQDIRDYMSDHGVTQKVLANQMGVSVWTVCQILKKEMSDQEKENILRHIDAIESMEFTQEAEEIPHEEEDSSDASVSPKFQIGDRVKVPSKDLRIGIVTDIWHSLAQSKLMYAVNLEGGNCGLYAEEQLEPAPIPITYTWEAHIDGNVAVVTMNAKQGDKEWVYARGHAHIIHDGEAGMAQAVSYAARRMFESLDRKLDNPIYFNDKGRTNDDQ